VTCFKLALDELKNESDGLFGQRNINFAIHMAFPFTSSLIMLIVYKIHLLV
jgi:hypothetical protein